MSRASKYKYEKGDEVGLYRIIRPLPSEPNVKNLKLYCECLLCGTKVKRWSNRLESKHRGCTVPAVVDKSAETEPIVVAPKPHTRADGKKVVANEHGFITDEVESPEQIVAEAHQPDGEKEELIVPHNIELSPEVVEALSADIDSQAVEIIRLAKGLDVSTNFIFVNTFRRYIHLLHLSRSLEYKINQTGELTILGATGTQIANPLIVQYKQVSAESNAVIKVLLGIVAKMNSKDNPDNDPLARALRGDKALVEA